MFCMTVSGEDATPSFRFLSPSTSPAVSHGMSPSIASWRCPGLVIGGCEEFVGEELSSRPLMTPKSSQFCSWWGLRVPECYGEVSKQCGNNITARSYSAMLNLSEPTSKPPTPRNTTPDTASISWRHVRQRLIQNAPRTTSPSRTSHKTGSAASKSSPPTASTHPDQLETLAGMHWHACNGLRRHSRDEIQPGRLPARSATRGAILPRRSVSCSMAWKCRLAPIFDRHYECFVTKRTSSTAWSCGQTQSALTRDSGEEKPCCAQDAANLRRRLEVYGLAGTWGRWQPRHTAQDQVLHSRIYFQRGLESPWIRSNIQNYQAHQNINSCGMPMSNISLFIIVCM